ncbi:MAG: hypothetical protein ACRESJ_31615, partial [Pseudomonas sp.]|uniref:hypothetical protein n=1 Tax=Pseudomonas sp. TaxID=306 RepID=UPI003D6FC108
SASSIGTRLLSLSTIADAKISNPPWVNFQSAGWVSFQSAPTADKVRHSRWQRNSGTAQKHDATSITTF